MSQSDDKEFVLSVWPDAVCIKSRTGSHEWSRSNHDFHRIVSETKAKTRGKIHLMHAGVSRGMQGTEAAAWASAARRIRAATALAEAKAAEQEQEATTKGKP